MPNDRKSEWATSVLFLEKHNESSECTMDQNLKIHRTDDIAPPDPALLLYMRLLEEGYSRLAVHSYCSRKQNTTHMERFMKSKHFHSKRTQINARAGGKQNEFQKIICKYAELPDTPRKSKIQNKYPSEKGNNRGSKYDVQQHQPRELRHVFVSSSKQFISSHHDDNKNLSTEASI